MIGSSSVSAILAGVFFLMTVGVDFAQAGVNTNCFFSGDLRYVYQLYGYSGNFTNVKEYTLKGNATCDFIVDVNSKITWWSEGKIEAEILPYHELAGNEFGCQANNTDRHPYEQDTTIFIGKEYNSTCMVKYFLHNTDQLHNLKLQIYKDGDNRATRSSLAIVASVLALLATLM